MSNKREYQCLIFMLETVYALHVARINLFQNPEYFHSHLSFCLEALINMTHDILEEHFERAGFTPPVHLNNLYMTQKYLHTLAYADCLDKIVPFYTMPYAMDKDADVANDAATEEYFRILRDLEFMQRPAEDDPKP